MWNDVDARYTTRYPCYTLRGGKSLLHLLSFEALLFDDIAIVPCLSAASRLSEDIMPSPLPGRQEVTQTFSFCQLSWKGGYVWLSCCPWFVALVVSEGMERKSGCCDWGWHFSLQPLLSSEDYLWIYAIQSIHGSGAIEGLTIAVDFWIWIPSNCMAMLRYRLFMLCNMKALIENYGGASHGVIRCYLCQ